jgi:signal transduction histidine kinase
MTSKEKSRKTMNFAARITFIYILLGSLWILFSDKLMFVLFSDNHTLNLLSTYKGWFYVLLTGVLFYSLIKRELEKRNTIEKQLKAARDKAEESEMLKTAFLHNISHEIRTPMNAIIGFSELIVDPNLTTDQKKSFSVFIKRGVANLLATIEDIIIVSRLQVGHVNVEATKDNIVVLMNELKEYYQLQLDSQKKGEKLKLVFNSKLKPEDELILADFRNIRQVMNHLLSNAMKFSEIGSIEFSCEKTASQELLFVVKDTGIGIPDKKKDIVFNAFRKVEESSPKRMTDGSGLGLSISKGLVELMNGRIWFESETENGCTFFFTVPFIKG